MQICAISAGVQGSVLNINLDKKNIINKDVRKNIIPKLNNNQLPIQYYNTNISFGASAADCKKAIDYVGKSQLEHLKRLVQKDKTVLSAKSDHGTTLLGIALSKYSERTPLMVNYLLGFPETDINAINNEKCTPLRLFINYNNASFHNVRTNKDDEIIFDILYSTGKLDISDEDGYENTLLYDAIAYGRHAFAVKLLSCPELNVNKQSSDGRTAFMKLCSIEETDGKSDGINMFKKFLARPDLRFDIENNKGEDAILLAESSGNYRFVDMINKELEKRAKANNQMIFNKDTLLPENNIYTVEQISREAAARIRNNDIQGLEELMEWTPLLNLDRSSDIMAAAFASRYSEIIEMLLNYKRNIQPAKLEEYQKARKNFMDNTLQKLDYAELKKNGIVLSTEDGFRFLMSKPEFNPNDKVDKQTLFEMAADIDADGSITGEILSKYKDVYTENVMKYTNNENIKKAIEQYTENGNYQIWLDDIKQRLSNPTTVDAALSDLNRIFVKDNQRGIRDKDGNNPLLLACKAYNKNITQVIEGMKSAFDIQSRNNKGQNALMVAVDAINGKENDEEAVARTIENLEYLLSQGIDINATDYDGKTLFHHICRTQSSALLEWVLDKGVNVFCVDNDKKRGAKYLSQQSMIDMYNQFLEKNS